MNKSDVAYLVSFTFAKDDYGVYQRTETKTKVYVNVTSVNQAEWFEGGRNGLNPQYRFTMFRYDYSGQDVIEYNGEQYSIYRTFIREHEEIELYTELRKGNAKKEEDQGV